MNASNRGNGGNGDDGALTVFMLIIVGMILCYVVLPYIYESNKQAINTVIITVSRILLYPFALVSNEAAYVYYHFGIKMSTPEIVTWDHAYNLIIYVSAFYRWIVALLIGGMAIWSYHMCISDKFRRRLDLQGLLQNNVKIFPALAPVVLRRRSLLEESYDIGPWRTARQPIQFAVEHNLLLNDGQPIPKSDVLLPTGLANPNSKLLAKGGNTNVKLDFNRLNDVLVEQLGAKLTDPFQLPDYQRGLAAAFLAFACGNKKAAQALLDQMSRSFQERFEAQQGMFGLKSFSVLGMHIPYPSYTFPKPLQDWSISIDGADDLLHHHLDSEVYRSAVEQHGVYTSTFLITLLNSARRKGVLPPAQFLWLRPRDRSLWYTLHQVGGRQPWAEALAPWGHWQAEQVLGVAIDAPELAEAITGFEMALYADGWLPATSGGRP